MTIQEIKEIFHQKGLKTTPQRIAVYYALSELKHPCAEDVLKHVRETHPTVTTGTIYNVLDSLVKTGLITKVHTDDNKMYFDWDTSEHQHLYFEDTQHIADYREPGLNQMIREYFDTHHIPGFRMKEIKIQIVGTKK